MKTLISSYSFNAALKQVTFNSIIPDSLESILLITNVTDNVIIYNFADPNCGGTLSSNVLTLTYDTTSMSNGDRLQIFVDVPNENQGELTEILRTGIVEIVRQLQSIRNDGGMADVNGRVRVAIEAGSVGLSGTLSTVTTVGTVTNATNVGGFSANMLMVSGMNAPAKALRNSIVITA